MAISRSAYRNFSASEINSKMSATCDHSVNGSNVDCTNITTDRLNTILGLSNRSWSTIFADTNINHYSAWGGSKRSVSGGVLVPDGHYSNSNQDIGCWAGYNHSAVTPSFKSGGSNTNSTIQSGQSQVFSCSINIGEMLYNDVSGASTITTVFFSVWDGSTCVGYSGINLSSATDGNTGESILDFSQSGTRITVSNITQTTTYTCKIWFCSSSTWDYTGSYLQYKLSQFPDWTHQVRIQSANHWYLNGAYNNSSVTDGDGTFTSGYWDVNGAQINLSTGNMDLYFLSLNSALGGSWGHTGYDYLNLYIKIESGYYVGSTWYGTQESSVLVYSGSWNQSYITVSFSGTDVWTPGTGMNTSGYGYRFILDCQTS